MRYPHDDARPRRRRPVERHPYDRWDHPTAYPRAWRHRRTYLDDPRDWPRAFDAGQPRRRREDREGREERRQEDRREGERRWGDRRWGDRRRDWRERYERLRERGEQEGWVERGREFFRRYRQPIIGLTMAGAAAPIAKGMREAPREAEAPEVAERVAGVAVRPAGGLEEEIGRRWAAAEEEDVRADTVRSAMATYGISRRLAEDIHDAAVAYRLDPELGYGLVKTESAFDNRAISNVGARGLTQVMPRTARWLRPGTTVEDLYNRRMNLDMGFGYLRDLIGKYRGNVKLALLAYNRGPGTVDRVLRRGADPDNGYADKVLSGYDDLGR